LVELIRARYVYPIDVNVSLTSPSPPNDKSTMSIQDIYPSLQSSLLSHSRSLRLSTLRLLSSDVVKSSTGQQEVVKRCLQGEEVSVDVQGVRERVLRIGRVGQIIRDGDILGASIFIVWLIGLSFVYCFITTVVYLTPFSSAESQPTALVVACRGSFGDAVSTLWGCCVATYLR
jgi:hypothetical protein